MFNFQSLLIICLVTCLVSCGKDAEKNNGTQTNNGQTAATNNGTSNNGTTGGTTNNGQTASTNNPTQTAGEAILEEIRSDLDLAEVDVDFTFLAEAEDGTQFSHSTGASTFSTSYRSASTSKWVAAAVILSVVQSGKLSLDAKPQEYIAGWPATGNLSEIELSHLLAFTSGLNSGGGCVNRARFDFDECVLDIATKNAISTPPGTEFYYSSNHMQVAGAMAISAGGFDSWEALFADFKTRTGLFPRSVFDLPSSTNPRLAGGMHWTAVEYFSFLRALFRNEILTPELIEMMTSDQNGGAIIPDGASPAEAGTGEDWHYGFGNWIECHSAAFDCTGRQRVSSPGAYGSYPFIDFENKYFGIVAREGALGTFVNGYNLFLEVSPKLETWANTHQVN